MNAGCCTGGTAARRFFPAILPAVLLAVLPKCPLCFAAWIAAATGVALPTFLAPWTKVLAIAMCTLFAVLWIAGRSRFALRHCRNISKGDATVRLLSSSVKRKVRQSSKILHSFPTERREGLA